MTPINLVSSPSIGLTPFRSTGSITFPRQPVFDHWIQRREGPNYYEIELPSEQLAPEICSLDDVKEHLEELGKVALFELNDEATRRVFTEQATALMDTAYSLGIVGVYMVVCNESNNPPEVINNNEFVADIYYQTKGATNYICNWIFVW